MGKTFPEIQDHHNPLSQHGIASYVTKFESKSFRLRSNFGVAFAQRESQGARGSQTLANFFEQVSRLLCCAYAS